MESLEIDGLLTYVIGFHEPRSHVAQSLDYNEDLLEDLKEILLAQKPFLDPGFLLMGLSEFPIDMIDPMAQDFLIQVKFVDLEDFGPVLVYPYEDIVIAMESIGQVLEHFSEIFDLLLLGYLLLRNE